MRWYGSLAVSDGCCVTGAVSVLTGVSYGTLKVSYGRLPYGCVGTSHGRALREFGGF